MIVLVEMVKDKDLILGNKLKQTETVFLDEPGDKFSDGLFFELEDVVSLSVFAVEDLADNILLSLSFEKLFHLEEGFYVFQFQFREGYLVFNQFLDKQHKLFMDSVFQHLKERFMEFNQFIVFFFRKLPILVLRCQVFCVALKNKFVNDVCVNRVHGSVLFSEIVLLLE